MNNVNIIGRLGSDFDLKYTPSGKAVCELNLAVNDGYGENKKTVWLGVTIWGATAELAKKALNKGDLVGISGRLSQEEWEGKDGKKQRKTKVTCQDMFLLGGKRNDTMEQQARQPIARQAQQQPAEAANPEDEEIPF